MKFLLPHRFKKIGAVIAPVGIAVWLAWQLGFLPFLGGREMTGIRVSILIASIFSFLFGIYFVAFSKERIEDEMVQRMRLESFLFASWVQTILLISFFVLYLALGEPLRDGGLLLCFIGLIAVFWLSYLIHFNYTVHFRDGEWTTE